MVGAKCQESHCGRQLLCRQTLHGMEDTCWIVHHAKGIDGNTEFLFLEPTTYTVGKTGTDEEQVCTRADSKPRIWHIDNGTEFHQLRLICNPPVESVISTKRALGLLRCSVNICLMRAAASGSLAII